MKKIVYVILIALMLMGCNLESTMNPEPTAALPEMVEIPVVDEPVVPIVEESDFALYGSQDVELYDLDSNGNPIIIDDGPYDGYRWGDMRPMAWIPGMITPESYNMQPPPIFSGKLGAVYEPNTLGADKYLQGYLGAVELPVCGANGESVWIDLGGGWQGPFLVADCTPITNTYGQIVHEGIVIKISFEVGLDWGMAFLWQTEHLDAITKESTRAEINYAKWSDDITRNGWHYTEIDDVRVSLIGPVEDETTLSLREQFLERVRFVVSE